MARSSRVATVFLTQNLPNYYLEFGGTEAGVYRVHSLLGNLAIKFFCWNDDTLTNEWASKNIQVNAIAPGYFATTNTEALQADQTRNRQILERIPAGRWGQPNDLAGAALFLSSPASDYVTGTVITVDGGWMGR